MHPLKCSMRVNILGSQNSTAHFTAKVESFNSQKSFNYKLSTANSPLRNRLFFQNIASVLKKFGKKKEKKVLPPPFKSFEASRNESKTLDVLNSLLSLSEKLKKKSIK